jgi:BolA protein
MMVRFGRNKASRIPLDFFYKCARKLLTGRFTKASHPLDGVDGQREQHGMSITKRLREKLMVELRPTRLDVINESELHAGHRSSPGTGESHFRILVVSGAFAGKSRVERHRLVNDLLKDEIQGGIHALALATVAPGEPIPPGFSGTP